MRKSRDDLLRIGAGYDDVGERFQPRRRIDVGYHREVGNLPPKAHDFLFVRHVRHSAMRGGLGQIHRLFGTKDFRALPHKGHAAENDGIFIAFLRLFSERVAVPDEVRRALYFRGRVIMCKDERVPAVLPIFHSHLFRLLRAVSIQYTKKLDSCQVNCQVFENISFDYFSQAS